MSPTPAPPPDDQAWAQAIDRVVHGEGQLALALQPIVDLQRGVVAGHEVLARPVGPPELSPDHWFDAAARLGRSGALAARVLTPALELLDRLPPNTFLTVNLEPGDVATSEVRSTLTSRPRLDRLVVEITERAVIEETSSIVSELEDLRHRGATVAVDDAGAGYAGLQALLTLRPQLVKLDRSLISDLDTDPAKRALLRAIGEFANGIDAWVLGEGIETVEELDELVRLQVPLGQGYLLGRPAPHFLDEIPAKLIHRIQARLDVSTFGGHVASLVEHVDRTTVGSGTDPEAPALQVVIDEHGRPRSLRTVGDADRRALIVKLSDQVTDVAKRVAVRRDGRWQDPVVVIDGQGTLVGIVPVPRLLEALAE